MDQDIEQKMSHVPIWSEYYKYKVTIWKCVEGKHKLTVEDSESILTSADIPSECLLRLADDISSFLEGKDKNIRIYYND